MEHTDRKPLTPITESGLYRLKLSAPKLEKIKIWDDGTCSSFLFFRDDAGRFLTSSFGTKNPGRLALLVGKFTGGFAQEIAVNATPADYQAYLAPAVGKSLDIAVTVTQKGTWNDGSPKYDYKLEFPRGSKKPAAPAADLPSEPPF